MNSYEVYQVNIELRTNYRENQFFATLRLYSIAHVIQTRATYAASTIMFMIPPSEFLVNHFYNLFNINKYEIIIIMIL